MVSGAEFGQGERMNTESHQLSRDFVLGFFRTGVVHSLYVLPVAALAIWRWRDANIPTHAAMIGFCALVWAAGIWVNLRRYGAKVRRGEIPPATGDSGFRRGMTAARGMF